MKRSDLPRLRLANQLLAGSRARAVADVVRHLGAMQAQDFGQSLWAVGARLAGGTVTDVERALAGGEVVRSWPLRGTIHLTAAEDLRWMTALCAPRRVAADARRLAELELSEDDVARAADLALAAFDAFGDDSGLLGRDELTAAFEAGGIATTGQRGYHLLWRLAQQCLICIGPMRGSRQTFALLDAWVPPPGSTAGSPAEEPDRDAAVTRLATRFATSRGPVTAHDLARWSGLTVTDCRRGLQQSGLPATDLDGERYWAPDVPGPAPRGWREPRLLAGFDEYLIGYRGRDEIIDPADAAKVVPGGNGVFAPMLVVDGRIVGTWRRTVTRRGLTVRVTPFGGAAVTAGALDPQVERYRRFLGLPAARLEIA